MTTVELVLTGTPVAKGRPRFTRTGRTYTDAKTRSVEQRVLQSWLAYNTAAQRSTHTGPVSVELIAVFEPAASWPKWKRLAAHSGELQHTSKPDIDNLLKVIDGLNGHAWADDSQIVTATARKRYGPQASTTIRITFH